MSKRRVNKQQSARIEKIQANYLNINTCEETNHEKGLVLSRFRKHAEIESTKGELVHCSIRPNIDSLVAGDQVIWESNGDNQGVILSRFPRQTVLGRQDKRGENKPVAANITQLIIVVAPKPELSWALLDSYLIMAEILGIKAVILLNKTDLPCEPIKNELQTVYKALNYSILYITNIDKNGYQLLEHELSTEISVFVGQSGVGKSSLISEILPHEQNIQTAAISTSSELGCHTTSNSRYYHLAKGGGLIDSPGVREFGLWQLPKTDILYGFREFRVLTSQCKFRNCNHYDSPGCAIINSIKNGETSEKRYTNFLKITNELIIK